MGPLIPLFWTSGDVSGFQSQSGQPYSHLEEAYVLNVPEIHLWCDTCWPLGSQHGNQAILFNVPVSRHCWDLKPWSIIPQTKALPIEICWLGFKKKKIWFNFFTGCYLVLVQLQATMCTMRTAQFFHIFLQQISMKASEKFLKKLLLSKEFFHTVQNNFQWI